MPLSYVTAGESHGPGLTVVISGLPAGLELDHELIQGDLARRQAGYGRSPRQQLEQDDVDPRGGLRHGRTLGSPLAFFIQNRDHKNWTAPMSAWPVDAEALEEYGWRGKPVTLPRPGHADLPGVLKYGHEDVRNVLERASARETAGRVAAGAVAKALIRAIGIEVRSHVLQVGSVRATVASLVGVSHRAADHVDRGCPAQRRAQIAREQRSEWQVATGHQRIAPRRIVVNRHVGRKASVDQPRRDSQRSSMGDEPSRGGTAVAHDLARGFAQRPGADRAVLQQRPGGRPAPARRRCRQFGA